jgi:tetratricopeptide (TPR) repeat protein
MYQSPKPEPEQLRPLLALAAQLLGASRPADAIAPLREAASLVPADPLIQHDLGLACLEVGSVAESISAFQRAIASNPGYADAYFRLGIALERVGDPRAAVTAYERATALQPGLTEAWYRAGALVYTMGHREAAIGCFRRAAGSGRKTPFGRLAAARALLAEDREVEGERALRQLLAQDPANALGQDLLGNLLAESGRFAEARECFMRAVRLAPLMAGSYYDLVRCRPCTAEDAELVAAMHAALGTPGLEVGHRMRVHLALGKAAEDLGDYAQAMQHFDSGQALHEGSTSFDAAAFEREVDRLIDRCGPEFIAQASALGNSDPTCLLIVGMPRSGTTLMEQIISRHPQVRAGGEINFWNGRAAEWHQRVAADADAAFVRESAARYLRLLRALGPKSQRVTDKMPFNFLWAGLIHVAFPRATIIHCRRAAIDTALSIHQTLFAPELAFPTGGAKLVAYFRCYQRLTDHWRSVLPAARFIEVEYENLTTEPEPAIRRIIAACGLPWDDACLHPELNTRSVKTPSKWQTRQAIYRHSVGRWRRYEPWLGPLRALLD